MVDPNNSLFYHKFELDHLDSCLTITSTWMLLCVLCDSLGRLTSWGSYPLTIHNHVR